MQFQTCFNVIMRMRVVDVKPTAFRCMLRLTYLIVRGIAKMYFNYKSTYKLEIISRICVFFKWSGIGSIGIFLFSFSRLTYLAEL